MARAESQTQEPTAADSNGEPTAYSGAAAFPELVWSHYRWERELHRDGEASEEVEADYRTQLREFQQNEGEVLGAYWSTRGASAVALTIKDTGSRKIPLVTERESVIRLHRVSDWVTNGTPGVAELLDECDILAIKVGELLRGASERIAMQWILAVQSHLLGIVERTRGRPRPEELSAALARQRRQLANVEDYYHRAAARSARIVYVTGMALGACFLVVFAAALAGFLWVLGLTSEQSAEIDTFFVSYFAGALGALVSVLSRMASIKGRFSIDYEVGRPLVRRLGAFRPIVGAIFGVALYFLLASGLLQTEDPESERAIFYYGIAAFLAGFSERWTSVIFGSAQRTIGGDAGDADAVSGEPPAEAPARRRRAE